MDGRKAGADEYRQSFGNHPKSPKSTHNEQRISQNCGTDFAHLVCQHFLNDGSKAVETIEQSLAWVSAPITRKFPVSQLRTAQGNRRGPQLTFRLVGAV